MRENLDPEGGRLDVALWQVLQRCHLTRPVEELGGLDAHVSERGRHFSVGQRQLMCLARALLTRARVRMKSNGPSQEKQSFKEVNRSRKPHEYVRTGSFIRTCRDLRLALASHELEPLLIDILQVLCLDEATASVDRETDALIQATLREQFESTTVLTVAHRVDTVLDSDRVLVMHAGEVAEFAPPQQLLKNPHSKFYGLVHGKHADSQDDAFM